MSDSGKIKQGFRTTFSQLFKGTAPDLTSLRAWYEELQNLKRYVQWLGAGSPDGVTSYLIETKGGPPEVPPSTELQIGPWIIKNNSANDYLQIWYRRGSQLPKHVTTLEYPPS